MPNDLGDIGAAPNLQSGLADAAALFGFLELLRKTGQSVYLQMAKRIGDNILSQRLQRGFFVRSPNHRFAKFDSADALALLHLAAVLEGKPHSVPAYVGSGAFFAAAYGSLGHRYDNDIIYGRTRPDPAAPRAEANS